MPRRSIKQVHPGQPYAVEWPEWLVDCAHQGCDFHSYVIAGIGEAVTWQEAERRFRETGTYYWLKRDGLWYCPDHAEEK